MGMVCFTQQSIPVQEVLSSVHGPGVGAVTVFLGSVRDQEEGDPIRSITYEAYEAMALRELERIVQDAEARYGVQVALCHRLGRVPVGEISVMVVVGACHRPEAFEACRWVVEALKRSVPIWKVDFEKAHVSPS